MKSRQPFRNSWYILAALFFGLVTQTTTAQNILTGFSPFSHFRGSVGSYGKQAKAMLQNSPHVHIVEATYGDKSTGKTCVPNLQICKETSACEFTVTDGLCEVDSKVKTLEVVWDCGDGSDIKTSTAVKGAKISLACGN